MANTFHHIFFLKKSKKYVDGPVSVYLRITVSGKRAEISINRKVEPAEISRFLTPPTIADPRTAPVNSLGYLRVMFTVEDIDEMVSRLIKHGAQLVGEVVQYENSYRLCYIRGTEGLLIGLAEQLDSK